MIETQAKVLMVISVIRKPWKEILKQTNGTDG